jgi:sigma-70-like protein
VVEQAMLQRARAGDEQAFRELTDPYRRELQVHCYRMLGSLTDAEDMLQETLLAAWRGLAGFAERAVIALLTDDAWLSMPPAPHEYHGAAAIRSFLRASFGYRGGRRVCLVPTAANLQPALASYFGRTDRASAAPAGLFVLTMAGPRIGAVTRFHCDELYPRFGLPRSR